MWLVPGPFCAMQMMNNGRHLQEKGAPEPERVRQPRKNNIAFYQTQSPDSVSDLTSFCTLAIL